MARPLPWYPHYIEDFRRGTRGMTHEARSCYRELLDVQWEHGSIPSDLPTLARILGIPLARTRKVWEQIGEKFAPVSGTSKRLANERMAEERVKGLALSEARANAARGGRRPPVVSQGESDAIAGASAEQLHDTDHKITGTYGENISNAGAHKGDGATDPKVGNVLVGKPIGQPDQNPAKTEWRPSTFADLWTRHTRKPVSGNGEVIRQAADRIADYCRAQTPPLDPCEYAPRLLTAWPQVVAFYEAGVKGGAIAHAAPRVTVEAFTGYGGNADYLPICIDWLAGKKPVFAKPTNGKGRPPEPDRPRPPPAAENPLQREMVEHMHRMAAKKRAEEDAVGGL